MPVVWETLQTKYMAKDPILLLHRAALAQKVGAYHDFFSSYSKQKKVLYGFVEGKQDPSYYRGIIDGQIAKGWSIRLIPAGNKKKVYELYRKLDWRRFKRQRVCFFVDKDLSDLIPEQSPIASNIFVTSKYSIENHFDSRYICERTLTEIYALSTLRQKELDKILDLFDEQREAFLKLMIPVMGRILTWRRSKVNASLDNIKLSSLVQFKAGIVSAAPLPSGIASIDELIHKQCKLDIATAACKAAAVAEFTLVKNYRSFVRGKYVIWFLIEYCKSVHAESAKIFTGIKSTPKALLELSCANAIAILGPRSAPPRSLIDFIKLNFVAYTSLHELRYPSVSA